MKQNVIRFIVEYKMKNEKIRFMIKLVRRNYAKGFLIIKMQKVSIVSVKSHLIPFGIEEITEITFFSVNQSFRDNGFPIFLLVFD